jgi:hypothetical protein
MRPLPSFENPRSIARRPAARAWTRGITSSLIAFDSGRLLVALLFIAVFSLAAVPPVDSDLWWHLANGRLLASFSGWPQTDLYSFTAVGHPWVMHEWLADLFMYAAYLVGGLPLLVGIFAGILTAAAVCLYALLRRGGLGSTPAVVLTLIGMLAGSTTWGARPQLLNMLLAGVLCLGLPALLRRRRLAFALVPFFWLWANLHSGFLVGVILAGLFAAGEAFDGWRGHDRERIKSAGQLGLASILGLGLAALNPYGLQTVLFPLGTLTSSLIQGNIQEWASPDFHIVPGQMLEVFFFVILLGLATRRVKAPAYEWLWTVALFALALSSQRHVPLFVLAAAPLTARCAVAILGWVSAQLPQSQAVLRPRPAASNRRWALGAVNVVLLLAIGTGMIAYRALPSLTPASESRAIASSFPVHTVDVLATLPERSRVFNYYDMGGYLAWRLYPTGGRVFIDGRVEVYGPGVFGDFLRINSLAPGWEQTLASYASSAVLLPNSHPLLGELEQRGYLVAARDQVATLLIVRGPGQ